MYTIANVTAPMMAKITSIPIHGLPGTSATKNVAAYRSTPASAAAPKVRGSQRNRGESIERAGPRAGAQRTNRMERCPCWPQVRPTGLGTAQSGQMGRPHETQLMRVCTPWTGHTIEPPSSTADISLPTAATSSYARGSMPVFAASTH